MSEEQTIDELTKELWQRAANNEGTIRADAYVALGQMALDQGKFKESLAFCETAKEIFEQVGKSEYQREIFDVNQLDLGAIAKSFGLAVPPRVDLAVKVSG